MIAADAVEQFDKTLTVKTVNNPARQMFLSFCMIPLSVRKQSEQPKENP
jgi:hypothetical protein